MDKKLTEIKKQVVETTCGHMRKLPVAAYKRPGEAALQKILVPRQKNFKQITAK